MSASASSASASTPAGSWKCLSEHIPLDKAPSVGRLIGRSSNGAGILGEELLVFSGENEPRIPIDDDVHIFDMKLQKWTKVEKKQGQEWPRPRIGHASAAISDSGRFYIHGGRIGLHLNDETIDDLWYFQRDSNTWHQVAQKGTKPPPLSYQVISSFGQYLYLFGGCTIDHGRSNGLWRFDTKSDEWTELYAASAETESAPCSRGGPAVAALEDAVYIGFGYNGKEEQQDLWKFDLSSKKWSKVDVKGAVPAARSVTDFVALPNLYGSGASGIFVFGGEYTPSAQGHAGAGVYHSDAFVLNTSNATWTECKSSTTAPKARGWFNSLRYGNDSVIVFGGFEGDQRTNDVWLYTVAK